jgi:electron transfer flavoprotein alpha subunit
LAFSTRREESDEQIADIVALEGEDTFTRPIYAGNAILKIKSSPKDKIKIVTVRTTAFDKATIGSGAAEVEDVKEVSSNSKSGNIQLGRNNGQMLRM